MVHVTDRRALLVEENLLSQFELIAGTEHVSRLPDRDVVGFHRDIAFPIFNAVTGARFAAGTEAARAREVAGGYLERGLPWLWWATPTTMTPEIDAVLREHGLEPSPEPGMHCTLDGPAGDGPVPEGLSIRESDVTNEFVVTMSSGFGFPEFVWEPLGAAMAGFGTDQFFHVLATLDGEPVGTGSAFLSGPDRTTLGIYNIATLEHARRRGVGRAVTAELMRLGRSRGCTDAVLTSSEMGRPTYERLGFVEVCQVPQYVWRPTD